MNRYPLAMKHPAAYQAKPVKDTGVDQVTGRKFVDYHAQADRFPPVVVNSATQEAEHRARGYVGQDEEFPAVGDYAEYPKWLSHTDDAKPQILVNTVEQQAAALAKGYFEPGTSDPGAVERASASPYVAGRVTQQYPRIEDGKLVQDPGAPSDGPIEYPKALTPPGGGDQVFVRNRAEEVAQLGKWGVDKPAVAVPPAPKADKAAVNAERSAKQKAAWAKRKAAKAAEGAPA